MKEILWLCVGALCSGIFILLALNITTKYEHTYSNGETCYFSPDGHAIYCDGENKSVKVQKQSAYIRLL